jgi:hypothetical protein
MPTIRVHIGADNPYDSDSDSDSDSGIHVPDLTTENYLSWSSDLKNVLKIHPGKPWPIVSGEETATDHETADDIAAFEERQSSALFLIHQCIPYPMRSQYGISQDEEDPKVVWDKIRDKYRRTLHPWIIRLEMYSIRLENFDNVLKYTLKIHELVHKYNFAVEDAPERTISKEEHTFLYIRGLPQSWDPAVLVWRTYKGDFMSDPRKLERAMRDHEGLENMRRDTRRDDALKKRRREETALQIERDRKIRCFKCRELGHRKSDCPW